MENEFIKGHKIIEEITEIFIKNKISNGTARGILISMLLALPIKKEIFKEEQDGESTSIEE